MNVVVFLTDAPESRTHFFVLFIAELPRGYNVVGFEESIAGDETVLGTPVVISVKFKFKLVNFCEVLLQLKVEIGGQAGKLT